ncbi:MAG TPA: HDOD domain-containing protein, partial [Polyangiaceae bacterium]
MTRSGAAVGKSIANPAFALDEELWFGEGTDVEAESRAAASLAAVGARIVGAKPFPLAARRLDELTRNTNTRIEQVVAVLESDPALSARLLRLVNSAGYGLKIRCTSVRHAAVLVGSRRLNQVATTAAILDLFDGNNERAVELLEHAAIVGSLCRYLAVHVGLPHDEMFTCGFLHDIGKLMLLDAERERYAELLSRYSGAPDQIHAEERRIFGFDHAVLGAHVLAAWNIPEPVPKVIAWHHFPARAMQDTVIAAMVQTLRLADLLSYVLALHDEKVGIEIVGNSEAARYLDVSGVQLSAMWQDLAGLRERSRARSHGEPELDVMVPKTEVPESMRPRSSRVSRLTTGPASRAARPLQEVPAHFPCSVCGKQSYGNVCAACGGHVCPEHQGPSDEWCSTCRREFVQFRRTAELSIWVKIGVGLLVGGTLAVGVVSAARSANAGIGSWVTGPLVVVALWAVVLPVAYQLWQKLRFLHGRRHFSAASGAPTARASVPMTVDESGGEGSLDFPEPEGLSDSSPALEIGPISTASLALSVAPRSMRPLSMAPVSTPPSANSSRLSAGSPSPVLDAAGRVEPLRSAAPSTVGDVAADSDVAALERAEDAGSLGPPTPAPHTLASSAELAPAPPLPEVVDPVAPTVLGATPPTISAIPQP